MLNRVRTKLLVLALDDLEDVEEVPELADEAVPPPILADPAPPPPPPQAADDMAQQVLSQKLSPFLGLDGAMGPLLAMKFIREVDAAKLAGALTDARAAGLARQAMQGAAEEWAVVKEMSAPNAFLLWAELKALVKTRWVRSLTMMEVKALMNTLEQRSEESVAAFRVRVELAHVQEDLTLGAAVKAEAGYETNVQRRVRRAFLAGLRQQIRSAMVGVDPDVDGLDHMEELARKAELLQPQSRPAAVNAQAPLDVDAFVAEVYKRMAARGGHGGGRGGRGRGGGGGRGGASSAGAKEFQGTCGRCGLVDSHPTPDCVVNLEKLERRKKGKFAPRGAGRRGGHGAAADSYDVEQEEAYSAEYMGQGNE